MNAVTALIFGLRGISLLQACALDNNSRATIR